MINETVVIDTNSQGHPILLRCSNQGINVLITKDPVTDVTDIEIKGGEASLRVLAEVLIGVSKTKGYHVHIDGDSESSPLSIRPSDVRLTISNVELHTQVDAASPPPDWARG